MPEICGDAVEYCDPHNIVDIKNKIEEVLMDDILQKDMIQKGLKRVEHFTWKKSAKEHMAVFEELLKN